MRFDKNGDYKKQFNDAVTAIIGEMIGDRSDRMKRVDTLINEYASAIGERPEGQQLERLTDYILREELLDTNQWKAKQAEYPFLSETQLARRMEGVHQRKNEAGTGEVALEKAWAVATDGRNYSVPKRRERSNNENITVDQAVKSRNKERRDKYNSFTRVQHVISYKLSKEEMEVRGWL